MKLNSYLPKDRSFYNPSDSRIQNFSSEDSIVNLPNPLTDSIVVNNIATQEFDYTDDPLDSE